MMTMGIACFWDNCVEDIITFSHSNGNINEDNCLTSVTILENINKELNEIAINNKVLLRVILNY